MPSALGRVALGLLCVTCIHHNPNVVEGHHPGGWQPLYPPSVYDSLVTQLRSTIESNNDSLAQIARRCGFADPNYFARAIRKQTHLSPSDFRRQ